MISVKNTSFDPPLPYLNDTSSVAPVFVDCGGSEEIRNDAILEAVSIIVPSFFETPVHSRAERARAAKHDSSTSSTSLYACTEKNKNFRRCQATVSCLTGGLSNALFIASKNNRNSTRTHDVPSVVLVRIHFDSPNDLESLFVDRARDVLTLSHLSRCGQGPKLYGRFLNGRIEEFFPNVSPIQWSEMSSELYQSSIAQAMAKMHLQLVPTNDCTSEVSLPSKGEIFDKVDKWFQFLEQISSLPEAHIDDARLQDLDALGRMKREWEWLKAELQPVIVKSSVVKVVDLAKLFAREIVFCHMDCQSLNILKSSSEPGIKLIDFEYAGYNPRAADIANTFCEHCDMNNLRAKFIEQYPTEKQQDAFLRVYICEVDKALPALLDKLNGWEEFMAELRDEVWRHALISHLGWAVWAIIQSLTSPIEFDYVQYAVQRMEGYDYFKKKLWCDDS
jgi:thiamine kinase-like enzyme